jgi:hypothetical protein
MENKLPKYYAVKNDGTEDFKRFLTWLNKKYNQFWKGTAFKYYGYDGNEMFNGTDYWDDISQFQNNPVIFETAKEFMDLVDAEEQPKSKEPISFPSPEQWAKDNGYIKLGQDEEVIKKEEVADFEFELKGLREDVKKAVVLQPNQSVIEWIDFNEHLVKEGQWVIYNKTKWMFKVPEPPIPQKREVVVSIFETEEGTLASVINGERTAIPQSWKLIDTITKELPL